MSRDIFYHFILGAVQGVTEFLPVSSSAHLVITQNLFGFKEPQLLLDIVLHLGTLFAVVVFLWKDIIGITKGFFVGLFSLTKGPQKREPGFFLALYVILATIPTGIMGVMFKEKFEAMFGSVRIVGFFLLVTGVILFLTKFFKKSEKKELKAWDAFLIGVAQGIAICPGISRSGLTISTGIFRRLDPVSAAKFSFLLSIPAILGAAVVEAKDVAALSANHAGLMVIGFVASAVFGYLSLALLVRLVKNFKLHYFSYYCWALGVATVVMSLKLFHQ